MDKTKIRKLEAKGWVVGDVKKFLNLSETDLKLIEIKIALGNILKDQRKKSGYTQQRLAKEIRSSQSRIAKLEKGDNSITIDFLLKSLLHLHTPMKRISKTIAQI